jgi:signal transduction histidine kinase
MFCYDELSLAIHTTLQFGFFSTEVPVLVYYSHLTAIIVAMLLGIHIFMRSKRLAARILIVIALLFSTLAVIDIFLWTLIDSRMLMFLWSFWLFLFISIYLVSIYFLYALIEGKNVAFRYQATAVAIMAGVLVLSVTRYLSAFDVGNCSAVEDAWSLNIVFALSFVIFIIAVVYGFRAARRFTDRERKREIVLATIGIALFLFSFSASAYIASIANLFGRAPDTFTIEQYGYFGMTAFIAFLTYIIVRYRVFDTKLIAAQAIVVSLILLIGSQFFYVRSLINVTLNGVAFLFAAVFGYLLVRSVKHEIAQRRQVEDLAKKLEKANERLKVLDKMKSEFVSVASHQLRSPLTSIRGYASMLIEGSYGKLPAKAAEAVERIQDSSRYMALSVEDYLNVSRIESGNMKYEFSQFNLKDEADKIVEELRPNALKKGLLLRSESRCSGHCIVSADIGKTRQIIQNLVDNALKYTQKGTITVLTHDDPKNKKIYITVKDTGVGMSKGTLEDLFEKFVRAKNANQINVTGTGLGLFVAKRMVENMHGRIWAESEGEGKGSAFHVELPLTGKKK